MSRTLDTLGPLAQTVADCVLTDAALRGLRTPDAQPAALSSLNFVIPDTHMMDDLSPAVAANFEAAVARLSAAGARVARTKLPELREVSELMGRYGPLASAEAMDIHQERLSSRDADRIDPRVVRRILMADGMKAVDLIRLYRERREWIAWINARLGRAILICPTTPTVAMPIAPLEADTEVFFHHNFRTLRNTAIGNFLDWCGLSIPSGTDSDGMPTGFMLCAPHGQDRDVLAAGLAIETLVRG